MHEWALAEAVISTALKVAKKEGLQTITEIKVVIGELQQIDAEIFRFALTEVMQPQRVVLEKAQISIQEERALLQCKNCNHQWHPKEGTNELGEEAAEAIHFVPEVAHVHLRCPKCGSADFEVAGGRGIWIESISGESR